VHPVWGILRLRYDLFDSGDPASWTAFCDDAHEALFDFEHDLKDNKEIQRLRDPKVEHASILDRARPIEALVELESKMRADLPPPTVSLEKQAIYWRDLLLICLLISNPLRASNFTYLTYRPNDRDNPGHLRKQGDEWWLNIPLDQFKNDRRAKAAPYIEPIPHRLWPLVEDYTANWRPLLRGADTSDRLLLPSSLGRRSAKWKDPTETACLSKTLIFRIVTKYTRAYIRGCPGSGPHAFRHIIATDYLSVNPSGHFTVAAILHDTVETVFRDYDHLKVADARRPYDDHLNEAFGARARQ
jgi:integrase